MTTRIIQIALKIALLMEEYSESDIIQAVKLLKYKSSPSALLEYLKSDRSLPKPTMDSFRKKKRTDEQRSKAVIDLEIEEPDKFRILSELDSELRLRNVLPDLEDIMRMGERLSKDFAPKRSRMDAVRKLMALLAEKQLSEIKEIYDSILSSPSSVEKKREYQDLAQFIITGKNTERLTEK
jgi:hypothetical protein